MKCSCASATYIRTYVPLQWEKMPRSVGHLILPCGDFHLLALPKIDFQKSLQFHLKGDPFYLRGKSQNPLLKDHL